jgi:hypothetical protein
MKMSCEMSDEKNTRFSAEIRQGSGYFYEMKLKLFKSVVIAAVGFGIDFDDPL